MTLNKYRTFDILMFSIFGFVFSLGGEFLFSNLKVDFYLNLGFLIALIAVVRWNGFGLIPFVVAGIPIYIFRFNSSSWHVDLLFHVVANASIGLSALLFRFYNKDKIGTGIIEPMIYLLSTALILVLTKSLVMLLLSSDYISNMIVYASYNAFTFIICSIFFYLIRLFSEELIVDMKMFFIRKQEIENES